MEIFVLISYQLLQTSSFHISHRNCKHIAKALQADFATKALSKSLQTQRTREIVLKNLPTPKKIKNTGTRADRKERN